MTTRHSERAGTRLVGSAAYRLSGWLAAVAAVAAALTFLIPGVLTGPAAMNGSARGTALVAGLVAVPLMVLAMVLTAHGSMRAAVVWMGTVGYLLYNAVLFAFATPFNELFLLYVAMLSLSLWSVLALVHDIDAGALAARFSPGLRIRAIVVYIWVIVGLNTLVWLRGIVPAVLDEEPTAFLADTGLTTNPVYVQDLAWWLPLMAMAGLWLWRRHPRGYLVAGAGLTFWVVEAVGVAVDQAFGHAADPESSVTSLAIAWMFAALALVGLVPLYHYLRHLAGSR